MTLRATVMNLTFAQLLFLTLVTFGVGRLPNLALRKWMYGWAARTCFRVLSRSFSAVIHFHDTQYRKDRRRDS